MTTQTDTAATNLMQALAPFFTATVNFKAIKADNTSAYNCAYCGTDIGPLGTEGAISYHANRYGTWAHAACVKKAGLAASDDGKAKKKAHEAARAAHQATTRTSKPASPRVATATIPADEARLAEITAQVEADYEARMAQAVEVIQKLIAERDDAQRECSALKELLYITQQAA